MGESFRLKNESVSVSLRLRCLQSFSLAYVYAVLAFADALSAQRDLRPSAEAYSCLAAYRVVHRSRRNELLIFQDLVAAGLFPSQCPYRRRYFFAYYRFVRFYAQLRLARYYQAHVQRVFRRLLFLDRSLAFLRILPFRLLVLLGLRFRFRLRFSLRRRFRLFSRFLLASTCLCSRRFASDDFLIVRQRHCAHRSAQAPQRHYQRQDQGQYPAA